MNGPATPGRDAAALVANGKASIAVCELATAGLRELVLNGLTRRRWERVRSVDQLLTTSLTARVYAADQNRPARVVAGGETIWSGWLNASARWHELASEEQTITVYLALVADAPVRSLADLDRAAQQGHVVAVPGQLRS